jgi:hypothetical protein
MITLPALWLLMRALFPGAVGRSRDRIASNPVACFFLGLLPAGLLFGGAAVLANVGGAGGKAVAFLLIVAGVLLGGVGLAGFSAVVGDRLPSAADAGRPWRGLVRGAVCLELSFLLPFIGWFGVLPIALTTGLGAAVLSLVAPAAPAAPDSPAPLLA